MKKLLLRLLALVLGICLAGFCALEGVVVMGSHSKLSSQPPSVMIILGALVDEDGPSPALVSRMDAALCWLSDHPDTQVILSGGRGRTEPVSEARAMADYMIAQGFPEEQLHLEEASSNTVENLKNSRAVMTALGYDPGQTRVVVVSNYFHLARVRLLCHRLGLRADTLGARVPTAGSAVRLSVREAFALVKSFLVDRGL